MKNNPLNIFIDKLNDSLDNKALIKLTINGKKNKMSDLKSIIVTIVELKKGTRLNFVYRHETKDITKNFEFQEGIDLIKKALEMDFYNADMYSNSENVSLISNQNGKIQIKTTQATLQPLATFSHDKQKERFIHMANNIYLRELGIANANGEVRREMNDKYRQINRYIELLEPYLSEIEINNDFEVVDMGAGKGYLTFALYDFLRNTQKKNVHITGVEYRNELVEACNAIANKANFLHLKFIQGTIEKTEIVKIDILIALHACDTATDEAIFRGIKSNASLIVCAPCCHKQIRKELNVNPPLSNMVKFGILKERQAEIITDTLRAMIMEAYGYKTNVFEFISTEHTPKNLMIVGKKVHTPPPDRQAIIDNIHAIKQIYGINTHYLETLLGI